MAELYDLPNTHYKNSLTIASWRTVATGRKSETKNTDNIGNKYLNYAVNNWKILLEQSFIICKFHCLHTLAVSMLRWWSRC